MRDPSRPHQEITLPTDPPDLSEHTVLERAQEIGIRPADLLLQDINQEWLGAESRFQEKGDLFGVELAQKIQILCDALQSLINPVPLRLSQQIALRDMIASEAGAGRLLQIQDPGNACRAVLSMAIYIHSCHAQTL